MIFWWLRLLWILISFATWCSIFYYRTTALLIILRAQRKLLFLWLKIRKEVHRKPNCTELPFPQLLHLEKVRNLQLVLLLSDLSWFLGDQAERLDREARVCHWSFWVGRSHRGKGDWWLFVNLVASDRKGEAGSTLGLQIFLEAEIDHLLAWWFFRIGHHSLEPVMFRRWRFE